MEKDKWFDCSLPEQIGNIGSEISRLRHCIKENDETGKEAAIKRSIEMIDLTLCDPKNTSKDKELSRLREAVSSLRNGTSMNDRFLSDLEQFCLDCILNEGG